MVALETRNEALDGERTGFRMVDGATTHLSNSLPTLSGVAANETWFAHFTHRSFFNIGLNEAI